MAIDFPNSPSVNQIYTVGSRSWIWDGSTWNIYANVPNRYIQDAAPSSPQSGDQWFESDTGRLFVYYDSAWVEIGNATDIAGALQPGQVTALSAVTSLTTDDVFPVIDNPSSATAANKITYGNLVNSLQGSFPRGVMAYTSSTTSDTSVTTEEVEYTLTWTASANRYYKISVFEPDTGISGAGAGTCFWRLRQTNISGTILQSAYNWVPSSSVDTVSQIVYIGTFSAGSQTVVATAAATGGVTIQLNRGTGKIGYAVVEDVGAV